MSVRRGGKVDEPGPIPMLHDGPSVAAVHLLLAHGAGAPMDSAFMTTLAKLLAAQGLAVSRFEFAYMAARRDGKRMPVPKAERVAGEFTAAVAEIRRVAPPGQLLLIGGKSMGGRVASLVADPLFESGAIAGLVCVGYPFHPPNQPGTLRTSHLAALACPTLIVQGDRDPFGTRDDVAGYDLSRQISIAWATDGDHDLKPRVKSGATHAGNLEAAATAIAAFASGLASR